jgi:hypothetical protein
MTPIAPDRSHAWYGLLDGFLMMAGLGLSPVPSTIVATHGLPAGMAGLGSALMNTSRLIGGALGLAILATIATGHTHGTGPAATTHGFSIPLAISAAVCLVGAIVALTTCARGRLSQGAERGVSRVLGRGR